MRRATAIFLLFALTTTAQQVGQNAAPPGPNGTKKIAVTTQMVIELVSVKDKKGNPIKGLTAKDFTLTEDGVAQQIRTCDQEDLPTTPTDAPILPAEPEDIKIYNKLGRSQIPTEAPGKIL